MTPGEMILCEQEIYMHGFITRGLSYFCYPHTIYRLTKDNFQQPLRPGNRIVHFQRDLRAL